MGKRKHFTVYWDEEEESELMEKLEEVARREKRSKSATMLVALREYVKKYLENEEETSDKGKREQK
jgi:predicted transcriptional regulator